MNVCCEHPVCRHSNAINDRATRNEIQMYWSFKKWQVVYLIFILTLFNPLFRLPICQWLYVTSAILGGWKITTVVWFFNTRIR